MEPAKQPSFLPWGFSPEKLESQNIPQDWISSAYIWRSTFTSRRISSMGCGLGFILLVKRFAHDTLSVDLEVEDWLLVRAFDVELLEEEPQGRDASSSPR